MSSCMKRVMILCFVAAFEFWAFGLVWADEGLPLSPRTIVVALDGTGDYASLQEAVDAAKTILRMSPFTAKRRSSSSGQEWIR